MGNNNTIAQHHAEYFYRLLCNSSDESPADEPVCIKYIDRFNDFYNIKMGCFRGTALLNSIIYAPDKVTYKLIERGADVDIADKYGDTPIIWATALGKYNVVKHLVETGVKINREIQYPGILLYALIHNHIEIAKYLIDNGIEFDILCYESNKIGNSHFDMSSYENFCKQCQQSYIIYHEVVDHIKLRYRQSIHNTINNKSTDNVMAKCFATTYVPQLIDVICEFII
ncbi:MAG: ankyrin repeat domain-containing protein 17 [Faunusvirus sp.]|jgi:ankyrin repeat protein|uniref:Ankyrin repeat domain-containing protein 17 n=1 Tax=Faunusvirus sp. TaxID=2487766 RepID=A0A3G4ZXI1_9VIRU|nr:MAG: ankyrin repeat domain-containing protein 17 [Faunusvirus sp.]